MNADHDDSKVTLIRGGEYLAHSTIGTFQGAPLCLPKTVNIGLGLHNEPVSNYFDYFTCICLDNPNFREFGSLTLSLHLQNLSSDS